MRVLSFVDTATGLCSFGGLRLTVLVGLLGSRIWFCKFLLFCIIVVLPPPGSAFSGLRVVPPSPVGRCL